MEKQGFTPKEEDWFKEGEPGGSEAATEEDTELNIEVIDEDEHGIKVPFRDQKDPVALKMKRQAEAANKSDKKEVAMVKSKIKESAPELPTDAHAIFGLSKNEPIDLAQLRKTYGKLARKVHPDQGGNADDFRQVSEAFEMLKNQAEVKESESYVLARLFEIVQSGVNVGIETEKKGKKVTGIITGVDLNSGSVTYSYSPGKWRRKKEGFMELSKEPSKLKALTEFVADFDNQQEAEMPKAA